MKFYDTAKIIIESGKWWDWAVSARREAGVPFWWPSGWNWGKWWDVIFKVNPHLNTLLDYKFRKKWIADEWEPGKSREKYWKDAQDFVLEVPLWTIVSDINTWKILFHWDSNESQAVILWWWRNWIWNMHFKNSTRQYPDFSLAWEPGKQLEVKLELQLLADVWLIWTPSVGKSSLINAISNSKSKVWDYPFTTLIPQLWSVKMDSYDYNVVDIPWLIEWAHQWKWLWDEFLRHVLKTSVFAFMIDMSRYDSGILELVTLRNEVSAYLIDRFSEGYSVPKEEIELKIETENQIIFLNVYVSWFIKSKKVINILINKADEIEDEWIVGEYVSQVNQTVCSIFWLTANIIPTFVISAIFWTGLQALKWYRWKLVYDYKAEHTITETIEIFAQKPYCIEIAPTQDMLNLKAQDNLDFDKNDYDKNDFYEDERENDFEELEEEWEELDSKWNIIIPRERKYREVYQPELSRLVYVLPWWNIQAELWFWKTIKKEHSLKWLRKHWVRHWDVVLVKWFYSGIQERYIEFRAE